MNYKNQINFIVLLIEVILVKKALLLVTLILSGCKSTFISYSYEVNSNKYNTEPAIEIYEVQSGEFTLFDLNYYVEINSMYDNYLLEKGEYLDNVYIDGCFKNYYNVYRYNKGQEKLLKLAEILYEGKDNDEVQQNVIQL